MTFTIFKNYKNIYYNFLVNFYLCLNIIFPYYDEVIISFLNHSLKSIIQEDNIKRDRMIKYIYSFNDDDKILLEKKTNIITINYFHNDNSSTCSDSDSDIDCYSNSRNDISSIIIKRINNVVLERFVEQHNNKRKLHLISNI
jgi:hypothetical protein